MSNEQSAKNARRKKRKKSPIAVFFRWFFGILLVFCLITGGIVFAYYKLTDSPENNGISDSNNPQENKNSFLDSIMGKGIKLNVAVFGVDGDGTRTDVMFVVHFDSKQKRLGVISLPRDTKVNITKEIQTKLDEEGRYYQTPAKLNAVHAYSGKDMGCENAVLQIEDLLNIKINHYVKIDFEGFRNIVDAIGGVEMDVPQNMNYEDPFQDLYIHLKKGPQVLDGKKAEQLVRFRRYPEGDVARVEVQQLFLKAFAQKILSTDTILKNLPDLISNMYQYVETDITLVDALKYVRYVNDVDMNNVVMEVLPGEGKYIGDVSYFIYDEIATRDVIDRVFYGVTPSQNEQEAVSSKDKKIEIANGGYVQGLAAKTRDILQQEGYNIVAISTYDGEKSDYTRIIVSENGMGQDLQKYFTDSALEVDSSLLSKDTDIKIILGLKEE